MSIVAITDGDEFNAIRDALTLDYEQQDDISLDDYASFLSFYTSVSGTGFSGSYDGQFFAINDLVSERTGGNECGMFGSRTSGTIKRVAVVAPSVSGGSGVHVFSAWPLSGCVIEDSAVIGGTLAASGYGGGFWGYINSDSGSAIIRRCKSTCSVSGSGTNGIGGFIGYLETSATTATIVEDSYFAGAISVSSSNRGQILGRTSGGTITIRRCVGRGTGANMAPSAGASGTGVFWDEDVAVGQSGGHGSALSTAAMKTFATYFDAGYDIGAL